MRGWLIVLFVMVNFLTPLFGFGQVKVPEGNIVQLKQGRKVVLMAHGQDAASFMWFRDGAQLEGNFDMRLVVTLPGTYTVAALSEGCVSELSEPIQVMVDTGGSEDGLLIPNVFTPNGDGVNDYFYIVGLEQYKVKKLQVFNRFGNCVYADDNYQNNWQGSGLNAGTYFYILELKDAEGQILQRKGHVLIMMHAADN